jgi:hypothetical protein
MNWHIAHSGSTNVRHTVVVSIYHDDQPPSYDSTGIGLLLGASALVSALPFRDLPRRKASNYRPPARAVAKRNEAGRAGVIGFSAQWLRTCRLKSAADSRHSEGRDGAGAERGCWHCCLQSRDSLCQSVLVHLRGHAVHRSRRAVRAAAWCYDWVSGLLLIPYLMLRRAVVYSLLPEGGWSTSRSHVPTAASRMVGVTISER